jgi:hypothetical protein
MSGIRAKVKGGRLFLDEPTSLPEGTVLDLVVDDEGDDLTREERQALNESKVVVLSVWSAVRGSGPELKSLPQAAIVVWIVVG